MPDRRLHRVVVVGTGTGVGKTRVTRALARALRRSGATVALKPVESGGDDDARSFDAENPFLVSPHPLVALQHALSPHLAARREGTEICLKEVHRWVSEQEARVALCDNVSPYVFSVIETAGGVLSPLRRDARNLELAQALEPGTLLLVGPDSLGVLHAMSATLIAMAALGRPADLVALSAVTVDQSTGSNAPELRELGIVEPAFVLGNGEEDASPLADAIIRRVNW